MRCVGCELLSIRLKNGRQTSIKVVISGLLSPRASLVPLAFCSAFPTPGPAFPAPGARKRAAGKSPPFSLEKTRANGQLTIGKGSWSLPPRRGLRSAAARAPEASPSGPSARWRPAAAGPPHVAPGVLGRGVQQGKPEESAPVHPQHRALRRERVFPIPSLSASQCSPEALTE